MAKLFIFCVLMAIGLLTTACPAPCEMQDEEIKKVHAELSPVIEAIEKFRQKQSVYPRSLNELVPEYLEKIPDKAGGRSYSFIRVSDTQYNLRVNSPSGGSYSGSCSYEDISSRFKELMRGK